MHSRVARSSRNPAVQVALALIVGFVVGMLTKETAVTRIFEPIGTLWVNAIRMPVLPLICSMLISAVAGSRDARSVGTLAMRTVLVFLCMSVCFEVIMTPASVALMSRVQLDPAGTAALRASAHVDPALLQRVSLQDWFLSLVPNNPIRAAADGALLPLVVFSLSYGLALTFVAAPLREAHAAFFRSVAEAMSVVIRWVIAAAPVGVFGLSVGVGAHLGIAAAGAIGYYIAAVTGLLIVALGLLYVVTVRFGHVSFRRLFAALLPAQTIGLTSRSSLAALPVLMSDAREKLGVSDSVTSFVLPLGASIFKLNAPMNWLIGALLVARLYGVDLDITKLIIFCIGTVILSFAVPGIPSGGFFVQAPLYAAVGLPPEGLGILIAVDLIPDIFKTLLNVTSYAGAGLIIDRLNARDAVVEPKPIEAAAPA